MQQSFKSRLAALEALEAQHGALTNPGALTADDCTRLLFQIGLQNVRLEADGRATRQWRVNSDEATAAIDLALLRLNAMLVSHPAPPIDTDHLAGGLVRYVEECADEKL